MTEEKQRISYTACIVILSLIALYRKPQGRLLVAAQDVALYKRAIEEVSRVSLAARFFGRFPPLVAWLVERFFANGMVEHYAHRKIAIRQQVEEAYAAGIRQFVILGGGFDAAGLRMAAEHPDFHVFEIDRPFMSRLKVEAAGVVPANFHAIPADLATVRLENVLLGTRGYDNSQPTVFLSEGVVMYLSPDNVADLLAQIKKTSPAGSRFLFTAIHSKGVRPTLKRLTGDIFLHLFGEKFSFTLPPDKMPEFLREHGFRSPVPAPSVGPKDVGEYLVASVVE